MKKIILFLMLLLFCFYIDLNAACNNETLKKEANSVKLTATPEVNEENDRFFMIRIENIKENMALVVDENYKNTTTTYKYTETNKGVLELSSSYIFDEVKYTVKIYSLDSSCHNMLLTTKEISTIKFNKYSKYDICRDNKEFEMCQPFYNGEIKSDEIFLNALEEYTKEVNKSNWEKILDVVKEYYLYVLIPFATATAVYSISIGYSKWRRKK